MGILDLDAFELGDGKDTPPYKNMFKQQTQQGQINWLAQAVSELNEAYDGIQFKYADPVEWDASIAYPKYTIVVYDGKTFLTLTGTVPGDIPGVSDKWELLAAGGGGGGGTVSVTVGSTVTGAAGTDAKVTNSGTSTDVRLDFVIPMGETGAEGAGATVNIGEVETLPAGSEATVENVGTETNALLNFGIPKGDKGDAAENAVTAKYVYVMPTVEGWQTISDGVLYRQKLPIDSWFNNAKVIVAPMPDSYDRYVEYGVRCTGIANGEITFECEAQPEVIFLVNVLGFLGVQ